MLSRKRSVSDTLEILFNLLIKIRSENIDNTS